MKNIDIKPTEWKDIYFKQCQKDIAEIQNRIAVAYRNGDKEQVKTLQIKLIQSFSVQAVAVKDVTENSIREFPGVDGVLWDTPERKWEAIISLREEIDNYQAKPIQQVQNSDGRVVFNVPTIFDRTVQTLCNYAIQPIAEQTGDRDSFMFRHKRELSDATRKIYHRQSQEAARSRWFLTTRVDKLFENVSHDWLLKNIPMDKEVLERILDAGIIVPTQKDYGNSSFEQRGVGTPQEISLSHTLGNIVLDGILETIELKVKSYYAACAKPNKRFKHSTKLAVIRCGDDILISAATLEILQKSVEPALKAFLAKRGLRLSKQNRDIIPLELSRFDFLGFQVKLGCGADENLPDDEVFMLTPSRSSVEKFQDTVELVIRNHEGSGYLLISKLDPIVRAWVHYHQHRFVKNTYPTVHKHLIGCIWGWAFQKYPDKSENWLLKNYFRKVKGGSLTFKDTLDGEELVLFDITTIKAPKITTFGKDYNPYLAENFRYFEAQERRRAKQFGKRVWSTKVNQLLRYRGYVCPVCDNCVRFGQDIVVHPDNKQLGLKSTNFDPLVLHKRCHEQVITGSSILKAKFKKKGIVVDDDD